MNLINNKYILLEQIGSGSFGSIFKGQNIRTRENVAIKIESIKSETMLLKNESIIYHFLLNTPGVPTVKWFGKDTENYYMVLNLLGDSLQNLKTKKGTFSLQLTLKIGIQLIILLKTIHDKGLVHRDIKPDNFLLGINNTQIHIIDFGFCKTFMDGDTHIKMKKTRSVIGSQTYVSINGHNFKELSRRDDLESLGYVLLYLYFGKLDWQYIEGSFEDKNNLSKTLKEQIFEYVLMPIVLLDYMKYVRNMMFEETPNYNLLIDNFKREISKNIRL